MQYGLTPYKGCSLTPISEDEEKLNLVLGALQVAKYRPRRQRTSSKVINAMSFSAKAVPHTAAVCIASIIHMLPLIGCAVIIILNLKGVYVGRELPGTSGQDSFKFLALQLVAKVLELLVSASLNVILFSWLRVYLVTESKLPLAAISSSFQISTISNLWSPDFLALCKAKFGGPTGKAILISLIILATLISLLVGPASATALKPYTGNWHGGGTLFWLNAAQSDLFPPMFDASIGVDYDCHPEGMKECIARIWEPVAENLLSFWPQSENHYQQRPEMIRSAYIPSRKSSRPLTTRLVGPFLYNPGVSLATIQSAPISDAVAELCSLWFIANTGAIDQGFTRNFKYYNDVRCTTTTIQPVVFAKCSINDMTTLYPELTFLSPLGETLSVSEQYIMDQNAGTEQASSRNSLHPNLSWIGLSSKRSGRQFLGAVVTVLDSISDDTRGNIVSCVMDARWVNASTDVTFLGGPLTITGDMQTRLLQGLFNKGAGVEEYPFVSLTPGWAKSVNIVLGDGNYTVFERLREASGLWDPNVTVQEPLHAAEALFATMLVNTMSLIRNNVTLQGKLKRSGAEYYWQKKMLNHGDIFDVPGTVMRLYPALEFDVTVIGYGYGLSRSSILSITVLLVYCLVAAGHFTYLITCRPVISTCWDSVAEMVALALKSGKSSALKIQVQVYLQQRL